MFSSAHFSNDSALRAYLRAVRLDPREMFFQLAAGNVAARLGQGELALALTREAVRLESQAPEVKVAAAKVAWQFGRRAEALACSTRPSPLTPATRRRALRDEVTGPAGAIAGGVRQRSDGLP